ncbi:MAG: outer membrane beta-barrel protein, partial [Xanthobacteraceae bacterium]
MAASVIAFVFLVGLDRESAFAADLSGALPTKAPPPAVLAAYDWSGFYLGGHAGYAFGGSDWTSAQAGVPSVAGAFDFSNGYNLSSGTGSYFLGFQAGYDYMTASRWLFGVQADVSFPSFVGGTNTISSIATGTVSELERVEFSGHVLGRVGYAPSFAAGHWLFYATGGLAFSYDQFTRTQLAGTPAGGAAVPGTIENVFLAPRVGGAVGGGVQVALPAHWTAQLQYLFTDYGNTTVAFPAGAQRFTSDLTPHELTLGLNYRFNNDGSTSTDKDVTPPALQTDNFAVHAQTTFLEQYDPSFRSPYT